MTHARLFTPFRVAGVELRNRIVIAPVPLHLASSLLRRETGRVLRTVDMNVAPSRPPRR